MTLSARTEKSMQQNWIIDYTFCSVVRNHFKQLQPLSEWDPLFLPLFILLCPEKELSELICEIPVYLSASFTVWIFKDIKTESDVRIL